MPLIAIGHARASSVTTRVVDDNWSDVWTADHGDNVNAVRFDADGNLYTGGECIKNTLDTGLRKYNSAGALQWSAQTLSSVNGILLHNAAVYAACDALINNDSTGQTTLRKLAQSDGTQLWQTTGQNNDGRNSVVVSWPYFAITRDYVHHAMADDPADSTKQGYDYHIHYDDTGSRYKKLPTYFYGCFDIAFVTGSTYDFFVCGRLRSGKALKRIRQTGISSTPSQIWYKSAGAYLFKLDTDDDNNVYTVGREDALGTTCWAYDADGTLLWSYAHGGTLYAVRYWAGLVYIGGEPSATDGASIRILDASDGSVIDSDDSLGATVFALDLFQPAGVDTNAPALAMRFIASTPLASRSLTAPALPLRLALGAAAGAGIPAPPIPPGHPDATGDGPALPINGWPTLSREPYPGGYLFGFPGGALPEGWPGSQIGAQPARLVFRLYWSSTSHPGPIELPLAGFQCRRRLGASTWLTVDVPTCSAAVVEAITSGANPEVRIYGGHATLAGETLGEMLMGIVTDVDRTHQGGVGDIRLRARVQTPSYTAAERTLWAVTRRGADDGRRWIECAVDPALRPNDTVNDGEDSWLVGTIAYRVTPTRAFMRVIEAIS